MYAYYCYCRVYRRGSNTVFVWWQRLRRGWQNYGKKKRRYVFVESVYVRLIL